MNLQVIRTTIVLIIIFMGCSKDDSPTIPEKPSCEPIMFEDQFLKDSFDIFKIYEDVERVIFINKDGLERSFRIENVSDTMLYTENDALCQGSIPVRKSFYGQRRKMTLKLDSIFLHFVHEVTYPTVERNYDKGKLIDYLKVTAWKRSPSEIFSISWLRMPTSDRGGVGVDSTSTEFRGLEYLQEYNFLGKNFKGVYGNPYYEMYFSKQFGIVSFKYSSPFEKLVFDRFEY